MKWKGETLSKLTEVIVVIPRGDEKFVFKIRPVLDFGDFEEICPRPKAPMGMAKGETEATPQENHPSHKKAMDEWLDKRANWMVIWALSPTEDLEWDNVKLSDPTTWDNYEEELKEAGFSQVEIVKLVSTVINASGLSQAAIDAATESFLAERAAAQKA